jgi:LuxR family transcriptional regulator, maltose regulon positive regulatory protein
MVPCANAGRPGPGPAPGRAGGRLRDGRCIRLAGAERQVLARLSAPLSVEQIAGELGIPTTETTARMRAIYRKLGVSSRRAAVAVAYERGLLR